MAEPSDIYATVESLSEPGGLPGAWAGIPCHPAFRFVSEDLPGQLQEQFSEDDLLRAGVMRHAADGTLEPNPMLRPETGLIWQLKPGGAQAPWYCWRAAALWALQCHPVWWRCSITGFHN